MGTPSGRGVPTCSFEVALGGRALVALIPFRKQPHRRLLPARRPALGPAPLAAGRGRSGLWAG